MSVNHQGNVYNFGQFVDRSTYRSGVRQPVSNMESTQYNPSAASDQRSFDHAYNTVPTTSWGQYYGESIDDSASIFGGPAQHQNDFYGGLNDDTTQCLIQQATPQEAVAQQTMPLSYPLGLLGGSEQTLPSSTTPCEVEAGPAFPTPTTDIDASQYGMFSLQDCLNAPTDFSAPLSSAPEVLPSGLEMSSDYNDLFADFYLGEQQGQNVCGSNCWMPPSSSFPSNPTCMPEWTPKLTLPTTFGQSYGTDGFATVSNDLLHPHSFTGYQPTFEVANASPQDIEGPVTSQSTQTVHTLPSVPDANRDVTVDDTLSERKRRDDVLLAMYHAGKTYKEIKRLGGFKEAESTLRGRVRTLTVEPRYRQRKPEWQNEDVDLLRRAVRHFTARERAASTRVRKGSRKMPWKKIGAWMFENGSSYPFASSTCAKKWEQVSEESPEHS